jgi:hypothetical protein
MGQVKSLFSFAANSAGSNKLFACSDNGIYDATAGGAIGAAAHTLTNGYCSGVNFTNSAGGNFLVLANGTDKVKEYNGTSWQDIDGTSTPAITGIATTDLDFVWSFKRRLFFIEKNTLSVWYLPVDSIAGAASEINLGPLFKRGGRLVAGTNWTIEGGEGADDYCVFLTSEGEAAVYKGTDPSSANTWALVGVYFLGRPVGRRVFTRFGGDVLVLTEQGLLPLTQALASASINYKKSITDKVRQAFIDARNGGATLTGWECVVHAARGALFINVPVTDSQFEQFVMNTVTGAWCKFQGWNGYCFEVHDGKLYFGTLGAVVKAWDGYSDYGSDIVASAQTAYLSFGRKTGLKKPTMFRPLLSVDGSFELRWGFSTDYEVPPAVSGTSQRGTQTAAIWDAASWDDTLWSDVPVRFREWRSVTTMPGYAISLFLQFASRDTTISWAGTDFVVVPGGQI